MVTVKCPLCDFTTDDAAALCAHLYSAHTRLGSTKLVADYEKEEKGKAKFKCPWCGFSTDKYEKIVEHLVDKHFEQLVALTESENENVVKWALNVLNKAVEMGLVEKVEEKKEGKKSKKSGKA